ncbi:MAG: hypothetical protein V1852_18570, partial [Pseudomonadota bacterium]
PTKPLHYFVTWLNHVSSFLYRNYSIFPISTMLSVHKKALHYFDLITRPLAVTVTFSQFTDEYRLKISAQAVVWEVFRVLQSHIKAIGLLAKPT